MKLPIFIAFRYLFSAKKLNAVHAINGIATLGFAVGAFAMIVILSSFNGFEKLVGNMLSQYDADITVTAHSKKLFRPKESLFSEISSLDEVESVSQCIQENVVIKFNEKQEIAKIKGVDSNYNKDLDSLVVMGSFTFGDTLNPLAVFGGGLSSKLGIFPGSQELVSVFIPKRDVEYNPVDPSSSLNIDFIRAGGIFIVHEEIDNEVFLTDLGFARELLGAESMVSSLEVHLKEGGDRVSVKNKISELIGPDFIVKTQEEQNELIYKIFKSEKWFTYAILSLVLLISAFNIFGSLIMLVLDKKEDISILKSMGADRALIRRVYYLQGAYIAAIGSGIGVIFGTLAVLGQQKFGWLKMENSIIDSYPVSLSVLDIMLTFTTVMVLGYVMSLYPAFRASRINIESLN